MSFNFAATVEEMLSAAQTALGTEVDTVSSAMREVLNDEKEALEEIWSAYRNNDIDAEELQEQLDAEKEALEAGISMATAVTKASLQKAINAAVDVLKSAITRVV